MNRWKYVAIVLIIVMLVGNAHAFTTLTALAQDETRTVTLEIERLKALDLSDDGVFDDGEDEISLYYGLAEVDTFGNFVEDNSICKHLDYDFRKNDTLPFISPISLDIAAQNSVAVTLILVEVDEGNFREYECEGEPTLEVEDSGASNLRCAGALALIMFSLAADGGGSLFGLDSVMGLASCADSVDDILSTFTNGSDDIFTTYIDTLPNPLEADYRTRETHIFEWDGVTNAAEYEIIFNVEAD